ncbi:hypothetical protein TWF694_010611 [Orbilia ellipsospora]|uniref:Uncharacterized protein n=1 Tax=Orbilia ellipsospora TaxID=2528407 RepID=A0AAV9XAR7_9PEZI
MEVKTEIPYFKAIPVPETGPPSVGKILLYGGAYLNSSGAVPGFPGSSDFELLAGLRTFNMTSMTATTTP